MLPEELPELGDDVKDVKQIEADRNYAKAKGVLHTKRRQEEYFDSLRKNLRSPYVKKIHLLLEKESDLDFIKLHGVPDMCNKINPVYLGRWMHYKDAFEYAQKNLSGEICMIMNADIYLGRGFENVDHALFERKPKPHGMLQLFMLRSASCELKFCQCTPLHDGKALRSSASRKKKQAAQHEQQLGPTTPYSSSLLCHLLKPTWSPSTTSKIFGAQKTTS